MINSTQLYNNLSLCYWPFCFKVPVSRESLAERCRGIVFLGTPLTPPLEWNPQVKVSTFLLQEKKIPKFQNFNLHVYLVLVLSRLLCYNNHATRTSRHREIFVMTKWTSLKNFYKPIKVYVQYIQVNTIQIEQLLR